MNFRHHIKRPLVQNCFLFILSWLVFGVSIYDSFNDGDFLLSITTFFIALLLSSAIFHFSDADSNEITRKSFVAGCVFILLVFWGYFPIQGMQYSVFTSIMIAITIFVIISLIDRTAGQYIFIDIVNKPFFLPLSLCIGFGIFIFVFNFVMPQGFESDFTPSNFAIICSISAFLLTIPVFYFQSFSSKKENHDLSKRIDNLVQSNVKTQKINEIDVAEYIDNTPRSLFLNHPISHIYHYWIDPVSRRENPLIRAIEKLPKGSKVQFIGPSVLTMDFLVTSRVANLLCNRFETRNINLLSGKLATLIYTLLRKNPTHGKIRFSKKLSRPRTLSNSVYKLLESKKSPDIWQFLNFTKWLLLARYYHNLIETYSSYRELIINNKIKLEIRERSSYDQLLEDNALFTVKGSSIMLSNDTIILNDQCGSILQYFEKIVDLFFPHSSFAILDHIGDRSHTEYPILLTYDIVRTLNFDNLFPQPLSIFEVKNKQMLNHRKDVFKHDWASCDSCELIHILSIWEHAKKQAEHELNNNRNFILQLLEENYDPIPP